MAYLSTLTVPLTVVLLKKISDQEGTGLVVLQFCLVVNREGFEGRNRVDFRCV